MKFDWSNFTEQQYKELTKDNPNDFVGAIHVGDISVDLINHTDIKKLFFDFYVLHENTGYGKTEKGVPYDFADGTSVDTPNSCLTYDDFKMLAVEKIKEYITDFKGTYSLFEHANRPLENW